MNEQLIAERVSTLLSHFWTAAEDPRLRALQINDWLDDLTEFPACIVAEAVKDWRRTQPDKRPTPGHIRALCVAMAKPPPKPQTPFAMASAAEHEKYMAERAVSWRKAEEWRNSPEGRAALKPRFADLADRPAKPLFDDPAHLKALCAKLPEVP